jgi:hypothetical protein
VSAASKAFGHNLYGGEDSDMCGVCVVWCAQRAQFYNDKGFVG